MAPSGDWDAIGTRTQLGGQLLDSVRQGGPLVLGPRSGTKDGYNALWPASPARLLSRSAGRVEQYYALLDDLLVSGAWGGEKASVWAEALSASPNGAEVLMRHGPEDG